MQARIIITIGTVAMSCACLRSIDDIPKPGEGIVIQGNVVERSLVTTDLSSVQGAVVRVVASSARRTTDDRGFFSLERLPIGLHQIAVERRGAGGRRESARVLEPVNGLFGGQVINLGTIELRGTGSLAGTVRLRDPSGALAPGAGALIVAAETGFKAIAGEDGGWVLAGLPETTVDVVAFQAGHAPARVRGARVSPGSETRVQDLILDKSDLVLTSAVGGKATLSDAPDASGGITVSLTDESIENAAPMTVMTREDGTYRFESVAVGIYRARFEKSGYGPVVFESVAVLPEGALGLRPVLLVPAAAGDLDGDGIADGQDGDRDGDGCENGSDDFPEEVAFCNDNDADTTPDEVDLDDDGDGLSDAEENGTGADGFVTDSFSSDTDGDTRPDPIDPCPTVAGEDPAMDVDEDMIPDACDPVDDRGGGVIIPPDPLPPELTGFSPLTGPAGTRITITGRNFNAGQLAFNAVRFGPTGPIATPESVTTTEIQVIVPRLFVNDPVPLLIYSAGRVLTSTETFTFLPAPEVLEFGPRSGRPGSILTIYGRYFDEPGLTAFVGPEAATIEDYAPGVRVGSALVGGELLDAVRVRVPLLAPPNAPVSITTDYGTSSSSRNYTTINNLAIFQLNPNPAGIGFEVTILGAGFALNGFTGDVTVEFTGAAPVAPSSFTDYDIQVVVPAGAMMGPVTVHHPSGSVTSLFPFIPDAAQPYIISMSPTLVKETELVRLTGGNLSGALDVSFDGVPAGMSAIVSNTPSLVEVRVPTGASAGEVTLTFASGTVTSPRPLAILHRVDVTMPADIRGPGFSADRTRIYTVIVDEGVIFDAETLLEIPPRVPLTFLPGGQRAQAFKVAPNGAVALLITQTYHTYVLDLPSFGQRGSACAPADTHQAAPYEYRFDVLSRFAFHTRPAGVTGSNDGILRVDMDTGVCTVLAQQMIMGGAPFSGVLPALDPTELIVTHPQGMATLDIEPGSPTEGLFTSTFTGTGVGAGPLVWDPTFRKIWSLFNGYTRYTPFTTEPGFALSGSAYGAIQSANNRWVFRGDQFADLLYSEIVRTNETGFGITNFGGGAAGRSMIIPRSGGAGMARFDIDE